RDSVMSCSPKPFPSMSRTRKRKAPMFQTDRLNGQKCAQLAARFCGRRYTMVQIARSQPETNDRGGSARRCASGYRPNCYLKNPLANVAPNGGSKRHLHLLQGLGWLSARRRFFAVAFGSPHLG